MADLLWDLKVGRNSLGGVVSGIVSALLEYKKSKDWEACHERMMVGWDLLEMFEKAKDFIVNRDGYNGRGDAYQVVRSLYFIERLSLNSPGWNVWNTEIERLLLTELCKITDKNRPYARIIKGIVYAPRDEFSPRKIDELCTFFNELLHFFQTRSDWAK